MKISLKSVIFLIPLLLLVCGQGANAQAITLVALGDSLTAGSGDESGANLGGFPARLLMLLENNYPGSTLNNLAHPGLTSNDVINIELTPAISTLKTAASGNRKIALIWVGSNDLFSLYNEVCDRYYPGNYPLCEQDDLNLYRKNMETILSGLQGAGAELYVALLDDLSKRPILADAAMRGALYTNITSEEVARTSVQVTRYNEAIRTLAATHGARTVDFYNSSVFTNPTTLSEDGNHPNSAGYDLITQSWYAQVTSAPPVSNPRPDIQANASDSAIRVAMNSAVDISLGLRSGSFTNSQADWWLVLVSPSGMLQNYRYPVQWDAADSLANLTPAYQGTLFEFSPVVLTHFVPTELGLYQLFFGVDLTPNGLLDMDRLFFDSVSITAQ